MAGPDPRPIVQGFHEAASGSVQYVVSCPMTRRCAIIDPVLNFDEKSGTTSTRSADAILAYVYGERLQVEWIVDTHPHADHLSAARYLKEATDAPTATGERVVDVQRCGRTSITCLRISPRTVRSGTGPSPTGRPSGSANSTPA